MEKLLTLKAAAAALSVSPEFLKKLQRQNCLHVIRLGRAVRVAEGEIERLCREGFRR